MSDSENTQADVKPKIGENGAATQSSAIQIRVVNAQNEEVTFKVKTNTAMSKIKSAYCERKGAKNLRFNFDGKPISDTDTPASLDMEEGDSIDVHEVQIGG